jgi:hypothetical protein
MKTISFVKQAAKTAKAFNALKAVFTERPICFGDDDTAYTFETYCKERERVLMGYDLAWLLEDSNIADDGASMEYPIIQSPEGLTDEAEKIDEETEWADDIVFLPSRLKGSVDFVLQLKMSLVEMLIGDYADNDISITGLNADDFDVSEIQVEPFDKKAFMTLKKDPSKTAKRHVEAIIELLKEARDNRRTVQGNREDAWSFNTAGISHRPQLVFSSDN